jgi:peptide chain release factor subunit 1
MIDAREVERFKTEAQNRSPWVSLYLDVDGGNPLAKAYRTRTRDLMKDLSARSANGSAAVASSIEGAVEVLDRQGARGVAIFGTPGFTEPFIFRLPVRIPDRLVAGNRPALFPLLPMIDTARRLMLVVAGKGKGRIYRSFLGRLSEAATIEEELPSKVREGGWQGYSEKKIDRHVDDHVRRFVVHLAEEASAAAKKEAPSWIVLMGSRDLFPLMKERLAPLVPEGRMITHPSPVEPSREEMIALLPGVEEEIHISEEKALSERLRGLAAAGKAVLGPDASLRALVAGQADLLALTRELPLRGVRCPSCGYLATEGDSCPLCHGPVEPGSLPDEAVFASVAKGCHTFLSDAGALPETMAAILRFPV